MNKHMEIYPQELEVSFAIGFKQGQDVDVRDFHQKKQNDCKARYGNSPDKV